MCHTVKKNWESKMQLKIYKLYDIWGYMVYLYFSFGGAKFLINFKKIWYYHTRGEHEYILGFRSYITRLYLPLITHTDSLRNICKSIYNSIVLNGKILGRQWNVQQELNTFLKYMKYLHNRIIAVKLNELVYLSVLFSLQK